MINNSAIVIIFNTTSLLLLSGIALTFIIEIVNKELLKYEVEKTRWWYMTDGDGKQAVGWFFYFSTSRCL